MMNGRALSIAKSLTPLVALTAVFALGLSICAAYRTVNPQASELLWQFEFRLLLTWWVRADRRARDFSVPFEFDAFVFWAWPIVVPYYLYRSRGARGLLLALGIWWLYAVPYWAGTLVHLIRGR
jgi:hypothetical protein